ELSAVSDIAPVCCAGFHWHGVLRGTVPGEHPQTAARQSHGAAGTGHQPACPAVDALGVADAVRCRRCHGLAAVLADAFRAMGVFFRVAAGPENSLGGQRTRAFPLGHVAVQKRPHERPLRADHPYQRVHSSAGNRAVGQGDVLPDLV
ncbi:hypothetical protein, partial [Pseudomonas sp. FG-3G]